MSLQAGRLLVNGGDRSGRARPRFPTRSRNSPRALPARLAPNHVHLSGTRQPSARVSQSAGKATRLRLEETPSPERSTAKRPDGRATRRLELKEFTDAAH